MTLQILKAFSGDSLREVYEGSKTYLLSEEDEEKYNCEAIYDYMKVEIINKNIS